MRQRERGVYREQRRRGGYEGGVLSEKKNFAW